MAASSIEQAIAIVRERQQRIKDGVISGHAKNYEEYLAMIRCLRDLDMIVQDIAKITEPTYDSEDEYDGKF